MPGAIPCYRVCVWSPRRNRWFPVVTRTRRLLRTLRQLRGLGHGRHDVHVERRPGKGIPMPLPTVRGPGLRLVS